MSTETYARRTVLRATVGTVAGTAAVERTPAARGQTSFGGWLDDVSNYDGVVDKTGTSSVTIKVGSEANGGNFGFSPPAVRVDPGTTVTWEWAAGLHNVVADSGAFESELTDESGFTFEQTFEETGVVKYLCRPHESLGMRGVVVVGEIPTESNATSTDRTPAQSPSSGAGSDGLQASEWATLTVGLGLVASLLSPLGFAALLRGDDS
jgi:halocyanin-like protein